MNVNSSEGAAFVTEQNVRGTNGIIHVIDNVLFKSQQDNNNGGKDPQNGNQKPGNDVHQRPGTKTTTKKPSTGQNQPNSWNNGHKTAGKNGKNDNNANQLPQYGQKSAQSGHVRRQKSHSGGSQSSRNGRRQPRYQRGRQQTRQRPQQQSQRRRYQRRYRY